MHVSGGWRKLHHANLHPLYSSRNIETNAQQQVTGVDGLYYFIDPNNYADLI
jgi:hypothetical protein